MLLKNAGLRKSRMSFTAGIDERIDELIETPLPLPPPEMDLQQTFGAINCSDKVCAAMTNAQGDNIKKLQSLCKMYYQHIQSLHGLVAQQRYVSKSLATPVSQTSSKTIQALSSRDSEGSTRNEYLAKIETQSSIIKRSQIISRDRISHSKVAPFELKQNTSQNSVSTISSHTMKKSVSSDPSKSGLSQKLDERETPTSTTGTELNHLFKRVKKPIPDAKPEPVHKS